MDNPLALWRDLSVVWLVLLTMIFLAVPGVVFYYALRGALWFKRWLRPKLLIAQMWALRIERGTARTTERIAGVPIALYSAGAHAGTTTRGVMNFLRDKRGDDGTTI